MLDDYPGVDFPVANLTMVIGNGVACDLFNACKKNPFVATLASGQSAPGFMQFMGTNAVQTGKTDITFRYSNDEESSMITKMYACDTKVDETLPDDIKAYNPTECTCSFCEESCKPLTNIKFPTFMDGFKW